MSDKDMIQGRWVVARAVFAGEDDPNEDVGCTTFEFLQDTVIIGDEDAAFEHNFALNEGVSPKEITLTSRSDAFPFEQLGIYELKGDELTICYSSNGVKQRPRGFSGGEGENTGLYRLERLR